MLRRRKHRLDRALLHDLALLHHADPVRHLADDAEIMGNEQDRHAEPGLQILEELENLSLHGDVERGCRLVRNEQVRLIGERHGDHHALPLAARELVRKALQAAFRVRNADLGEKLDRPGARFGADDAAMQQEDFADLLFDGVQRIKRRHRFLEHDRDVVAAHPPHVVFPKPHQIPPFEQDRPGRVPRRGIRGEPHDRERGDGFSRAGFADQRHRLALADVERDTVDGRQLALATTEGDGEVVNGEKGCAGRFHWGSVFAAAMTCRRLSHCSGACMMRIVT